MSARSPEGDALIQLLLPVLELNSEFLAAARDVASKVGLTPARWQVLAATFEKPLSVAQIAPRLGLGLAPQSVQRIADILVADGWAQYLDNPRHKRAKLLQPTPQTREVLQQLRLDQSEWANVVGAVIGKEDLQIMQDIIRRLIDASRHYRLSVPVE